MGEILSRNMVGIVAFAIIFLSSADVFGGNDTIPSSPQTAEEWVKRGKEAKDDWDHDEAIKCFEKAIELYPDYAEAYFELGEIYAYWYEQDEKAIKYYDKAAELNPDYVFAFYTLGIIYADRDEQYEKAIKCFEKVIKLNPDYAKAYNNMGLAYAEWDEQYDEAIKCFEKAIELEPDFADAYHNLGNAYLIQGYKDKAIECYKKAAKLGDTRLHEWLYERNIEW